MREHLVDVAVATVFGLVVYGLILLMKAKIK
jgi:capsule polysaccharide export protein KpsE/RkpR